MRDSQSSRSNWKSVKSPNESRKRANSKPKVNTQQHSFVKIKNMEFGTGSKDKNPEFISPRLKTSKKSSQQKEVQSTTTGRKSKQQVVRDLVDRLLCDSDQRQIRMQEKESVCEPSFIQVQNGFSSRLRPLKSKTPVNSQKNLAFTSSLGGAHVQKRNHRKPPAHFLKS